MIDVVNYFQNTLQEDHDNIIITASPYYMGWFQKNYPVIKIADSPSGKYVLQLIKVLREKSPLVASGTYSTRGYLNLSALSHVMLDLPCINSSVMTRS